MTFSSFFDYLDDLQETNTGIKDDFNVVCTTVLTLDKEKDRLCVELDTRNQFKNTSYWRTSYDDSELDATLE